MTNDEPPLEALYRVRDALDDAVRSIALATPGEVVEVLSAYRTVSVSILDTYCAFACELVHSVEKAQTKRPKVYLALTQMRSVYYHLMACRALAASSLRGNDALRGDEKSFRVRRARRATVQYRHERGLSGL